MELFDSDGNPIEAFTPEEVEKKLNEAKADVDKKIEEAKTTAKQEVQVEIDGLKKQITDKEEEMKKLTNKDTNFEALRTIKEDLEKQLKDKETEWNTKFEGIKTEATQKKVESAAEILAGDNKELKDKIIFHYNNFQGIPKDEEEFKTRIGNAYLLATGSKPADIGNLASTGGGFVPKPPTGPAGKGKLSEGGKEVGRKMGIADKEMDDAEKDGLI